MYRYLACVAGAGYSFFTCHARARGREGPSPFLPSRVLENSSFALKKAEPARQANCYLEDSARFDGQNSPNTNRRPQYAAEFILRPCRLSPMSEEDWVKTR